MSSGLKIWLKSDVQEQEIANTAKTSQNKPAAILSYLLKIGFTPTQIADSFAIATGGAPFLINRTKTYRKQGLSQAEAEAKAIVIKAKAAKDQTRRFRPENFMIALCDSDCRKVKMF